MENREYVPIKQELQNYSDEASENYVENNYSPDCENSYTRKYEVKEESGENNYNYSKDRVNYCVENNVERNVDNYSTLEQSIENNYLTRIEQNIENYSTRIEQIENNYLNRIEQSDYTKQNDNNYTPIPNYSEETNYTQQENCYPENINNSNDYSENVNSSYTENENNVPESTHNSAENVNPSENGADNNEVKPARSRKRKKPENKVKGKPGRKPGRKKIRPEIIEGVEVEEEEPILPSKDLNTLFEHISKATPIGDNLGFRTRLKKLDWTTIAFDSYTPEACMEAWEKIQNRQRHFRLLSELLNDAREWIKRPVQDLTKANKSRYPDFPKRPLSGYMLFYNERKEQILLDNPGIRLGDIARIIGHDFHAVDEATRNRYLQIAAKNREKYEIEVEEFYTKHPDVPRTSEKPLIEKKDLMKKPRKPQIPFTIYFEEQLKAATIEDRAAFKEQCKERWRNLVDDKKLNYINLSLAQETQYQQDLKVYLENHPEYVPPHINILTKEEKTLKSKQDGKPEKPPNSAYSLYSRILLKSGELRGVTTRERMKIIAVKWKELSQQERDMYKDQANNLMHQYKLDYAAYLESLPEEKRNEELRLTQTSRKRKTEEQKEIKTEEFDVPETHTDESQLIEVVTPACWDAMTEVERSMYVKYIQKIKGYFDMQHISAKLQASSSSDSHSDSDTSEN